MSAEQQPAVDAEAAARLRLIVALEEVRLSARALGLDVAAIGELHAPWAMRVDAWLWRVHRDAVAWERIAESGIVHAARSRRVAT